QGGLVPPGVRRPLPVHPQRQGDHLRVAGQELTRCAGMADAPPMTKFLLGHWWGIGSPLVPKLCLGTPAAKVSFATPAREAELRGARSQAELRNEGTYLGIGRSSSFGA